MPGLGSLAFITRLNEARGLITDVPRFLADVARLLGRVARDPRVPLRAKLIAGAAAAYAVSPFDVIPDIPVIGQLDDAWVVALSMRHLVRVTGPVLLRELWGGDDDSFAALLVLAGVRP